VRPTLLQALKEASIDDAEEVEKVCMTAALWAENNGALSGTRLTAQDAAAVALWTFSFGECEDDQQRNPFHLINIALVERSSIKLRETRGLIFLLLFGLRGLPRVTHPVLHRGIRKRVDVAKYHRDAIVTWYGFSSTTTQHSVAKRFLMNKKTGKHEGTLFRIKGNPWGYNLQPFSLFPQEEEILLEPAIKLKVLDVEDRDNLVTINLRVVQCPLLLETLIPPAHP